MVVVWIFEIGFVEVDGIFDVLILGYRSDGSWGPGSDSRRLHWLTIARGWGTGTIAFLCFFCDVEMVGICFLHFEYTYT